MTSNNENITKAYVSGHGQAARAAHARRTVANSVPYIISILKEARPDFVFLDVGCGPGSISLDIARQYPSATILGVDGNEAVIRDAQAAAREAGITNAKFTVGDALGLDALRHEEGFAGAIGSRGCDIVHAHQVLQHTHDPLRLLQSMRAIARQDGGLVAVRESDWGLMTAWPSDARLDKFHELFIHMARARGCDPLVGRRLVSLALEAGWARSQVEASEQGWVYSTPEERAWWAASTVARWSEGELVKRALSSGVVRDEEELAQIRSAWTEWADKEDGWYALPSPQIICRNCL